MSLVPSSEITFHYFHNILWFIQVTHSKWKGAMPEYVYQETEIIGISYNNLVQGQRKRKDTVTERRPITMKNKLQIIDRISDYNEMTHVFVLEIMLGILQSFCQKLLVL
jgi:hypothetical protein